MLRTRVRGPVRLRTSGSVVAVALAWAGVCVAVVVGLQQAGAPLAQVLPYVAAWVVGSTLPGVLVWRAVAGPSTVVRELGFGSVLGIVLQLIVWAVGTAVHAPVAAMALLPIGVVVAFLAVPGLRRHWWPRRTALNRTPARWHVAMAAVVVFGVLRFDRLLVEGRTLPPAPTLVPRDTWYNSAISYELSRTLRPQDPFAVGEPLTYHWFADAHITATAQLSGTPIASAMVTLWLVPILVVLLLAVAAAAQHFVDGPRLTAPDGTALSDIRRWWVGPLAAVFTYGVPSIWRFSRPTLPRATDGFIPSSPSGILALVLIVCLSAPMLDVLRRRATRGTWVVLTLLLATSVGTKPSILPVVAFGAVVVLVVELVRRRAVHWAMAYVVAASAVLAGLAAPFLTGSTGGSHLQLLSLVTIDPSYERLLHGKPLFPAAGGLLVPALADHLPGAVPVIGMLLLLWVLTEAPRLLSLAGAATRPLNADVGVLWACALVAGGFGAQWVLAHHSYSEHYFWTDTVAFATLLAVTNAVRVLPAERRARSLVLPLAVVCLPAAVTVLVARSWPRAHLSGPTRSVVAGRLGPYAVALVASAVAVLLVLLLRRVDRRRSLPMLTAVTAFSLAACVPAAALQVRSGRAPRLDPLPTVGKDYQYVSPEQSTAALWLNDHTPSDAVVASNMFCWPMGHDTPNCLINSAWLSGISGRRIVLGDWTYTSANQSAYNGTRTINRMPAPWPERRQLSTEAVQNPTPAVLERLRREYDARWIFADRRSTAISPKLAELAQVAYRSRNITIYRLADSYPG